MAPKSPRTRTGNSCKIIQLSLLKAIDGSAVGKLQLYEDCCVLDLRYLAWRKLTEPRHRLRTKTRRCLLARLSLVRSGQVLQDHMTLSGCGLSDGDTVQFILEAAPHEVLPVSQGSVLAKRLLDWFFQFPYDCYLTPLGCQRVETAPRPVLLDEDEDFPHFEFVQVQTASALPAPQNEGNAVLLAQLELAITPARLQGLWKAVTECVLLGKAAPPDTSILSVYKEGDRFSDVAFHRHAFFLAVVRSPGGFAAIAYDKFSHGTVTVTAREGLTGQYLHGCANLLKQFSSASEFVFEAMMRIRNELLGDAEDVVNSLCPQLWKDSWTAQIDIREFARL